jgi:hypothetical protein
MSCFSCFYQGFPELLLLVGMPNNGRVEQECFWMANLRRIRKNCSLPGALSVLFLAAVFYHPSAWSATIITSDIDVNTTWTFDNGPYIIDTAVSINSGATLIIDAQIEVRFRPGTSMSVASGGTLRVNGDPGKPVVFSSDAVVPAAGDWVSVNILPGGSASFDFCEIAHAGQGGGTGALNISSTGIVTVNQCDIHHNVDDGVQVSGGAGVSPVFTDVIIRDNGDGAVEQGGDTSPEYANVTLTGNGEDGVLLIGDYTTVVELDGSGLNGAHFTPNTSININAGGEVTVTAGTTLAFTNEGALNVNNGGDLQVRGATGNPVIFTSNAPVAAPGDWNFISVNPGGAASLRQCEISYAGRNNSDALQISSAGNVSVSDCEIHHNQDEGIQILGAGVSPAFTDVTIRDNGDGAVEQHGDTEPSYTNVTLSGNGDDSVYLVSDYHVQVSLDSSGLNGSHFTVLSGISILSGGDLQLAPGTVIAFNGGAWLDVDAGGTLKAVGTPAQTVKFTSNLAVPAAGDWDSIDVNIGGAASFSYCSVAFGGHLDVGAMRIYDADGVTINGCDFHDNQAAAIEVGANAQALLTNDLIHHNGTAGIDVLAGAEVTAHNNSIVNNGIGVAVVTASLALANNIISHNGTAGIDADSGAAVQLQYNDLYNPSGVNVIGLSDPTGIDGNISADPLFFDLSQLDFRLDYDSPAVDAGTSVATPVIDFLARTRFDNTAIPDTGGGVPAYFDMGALEQYCYAPLAAPPPGGDTSGGLENDTYCIMFRDGFEG